jgi:geranylgeranyl pyrophosphate synthase
MTLDELRRRHAATLDRVNSLIRAELASDAPQVEDLRQAVERGRGKQIRPLLVAEISRVFGREQDACLIGAVAESIHCASLVHDDIIDRCALRRGQATMNSLHGDAGALLLGDLLFTAVFSLAARQGESWLCAEAARTIKVLCEGELLQQACRGRVATPVSRYEEVIRRKTAALLEFAAYAAGRSAGGGGKVTVR